jgi:ParB family chromosome partitioning protein
MKAKTQGERRSPTATEPAIVMLAFVQLFPSALNPRKAFDATALEELAASIASDGLLQNLVVRPRSTPAPPPLSDRPCYEIVAGERRYRALSLLWERDQWDAGAAIIPCRVIDADDVATRAITLLENLQRQDISPIEEGEAFRALRDLDPARWSTAAIAERIRRTQRYVQQRVALVTKLEPELQAAIADGRLRIEQARFLTAADPQLQRNVLAEIGKPWMSHPDQVRDRVISGMVPASRAAFPLEQYQGERVELDDSGEVWLADRQEFMRLQKQAAKEKVAALRKEWHWAKLEEHWFKSYEYEPGRSKDRKAAGAVVVLAPDGSLNVKTGLVKAAKAAPAGHGADTDWKERQERIERARAAEERFEADLVAALREQPPLELLRVLLQATDSYDVGETLELPHEARHPRAIWTALAALSEPELVALAAQQAGRYAFDRWEPARDSATPALAERYGIELPEHLRPEPAAGDNEEEALPTRQAAGVSTAA